LLLITKMVSKNQQSVTRYDKKIVTTAIVLAIAVLVTIFAGAITFNSHQQQASDQRLFEADRQHFARIEHDVEQVKASLDPKMQPGDTATISKSCNYTSAKPSKGPLRCGVYLHVSYMDKEADRFDEIRGVVQSISSFDKDNRNVFARGDGIGGKKLSVSIHKLNPKAEFCNLDQDDYSLSEYTLSCIETPGEPLYTVMN